LIAVFRALSSLLRWIGAFDEEILERRPSERMRATATGILVIVVSTMAGAAATLTGHTFLHLGLTASVALGLFWASAIMALDRWLLLVIKRQPTKAATLGLAVPRVAVAVVAGFLIAKALVIGMFNSEVMRQAGWNRQETVLAHLRVVDRRDTPPISALFRAEHRLQKKLGTVGPASALASDPIYAEATRRSKVLSAEANTAFNKAQCELDGTCGTSHVGPGPVYDRKLRHAQSLQQQADAAEAAAQSRATVVNGEQQAAAKTVHADQRRELAGVHTRLQTALQRRAHDEQKVRAEYGGPIGLADRLDALAAVERIHHSARNYSLLLTLLLTLVDSAPAVGKALMLIGAKSAYEDELDAEEAAAQQLAALTRDAEKRAHEISTQEIVDQAEAHRAQWKEELPAIVAKVVAVQRSVTEESIERWERETRDAMQRGVKAPEEWPHQDFVSHSPKSGWRWEQRPLRRR
jgi:hypothetical protein